MSAPEPSPYALALAGMPRVVDQLIREHVPDPDGYCHVCRWHRAGALDGVWPCNLASTAAAAARVNAIVAHLHRPAAPA